MKHTRYLYFLLIAALLGSCKKEEMQTYNSGQYVQFTSPGTDTALFSFLNYPNMNSVEFTLPLVMTGFKTTKDLTYSVVADPAGTNAPAKNFTIPSTLTFKAGKQADSLKVILHKSPELQTTQYTLLIRLQETSELAVGQGNYSYKYIKFSDQVVKPVWWIATMDSHGLGIYTIKKYRLFIQVTGVGDLSRFGDARQLELMRVFRDYLRAQKLAGTPVLEEDGTDMLSTIPLK